MCLCGLPRRKKHKMNDPDLTPEVLEAFEIDETSEIYSAYLRYSNTAGSV